MRTGRSLPTVLSLKSFDKGGHETGARVAPDPCQKHQVLGPQSCLSIGMKLSSSPSIPSFLHSAAGADMSRMSLSPVGPMSLSLVGVL